MQMQKDGPFPCSYPECGNVFISMSNLRRHERTHSVYNGYQSGADGQESVTSWPTMCVCELCHGQFDSSTGLEMHKIQVHCQDIAGLSNSYNPNAYYPQMISQTVSDSYTPMGYSQASSFGELRRYTCGYCGKRLDSRSGMDVHMRTHTQEKPFICGHPGCGKAFTVRSNMRRHERTHTADSAFEGVRNGPEYGNALAIMHGCPLCSQQFNSPSDMEKHMERSHPEDSRTPSRSVWPAPRPAPHYPQARVVADQRYNPPLLSGTMPEVYREEKFHSTSTNSQQTQMQTHMEEKPFRCSYVGCHGAFSAMSNLRRHEKTHDVEAKNSFNAASQSHFSYGNPSYW